MAPFKTSTDGKQQSPIKSIISGGITGGIEICCTYPTEYLKTQMQLYKELSQKGMLYCIKQTYASYGILGYYRGLSVLLCFSVPKTGVRFGTNQWLRNNIFTAKDRASTFFAGVGAGVAEAIIVVTPQETLKTKLIHDRFQEKPQYKGLFDGASKIIKAQGLAGIYRGCIPTVLRQGSNQGIRFVVFDDASKILANATGKDQNNVAISLLSGGIAGACSVVANTPIDVVKTNMQGLESKKYKNGLDCFIQIAKTEGVRGLYKGMVPRLSRVILDVSLTFTLYGQITKIINNIFP